jgi:hypothetical protein
MHYKTDNQGKKMFEKIFELIDLRKKLIQDFNERMELESGSADILALTEQLSAIDQAILDLIPNSKA